MPNNIGINSNINFNIFWIMKRIIDYRFLLTPYATVNWYNVGGVKGVNRKYIYIFGFKIIDIAV